MILPDGLSDQFAEDPEKSRQREAFRKRNDLDVSLTLASVVAEIRRFLQPPMIAATTSTLIGTKWPAGGPWQ